MDVMTYNSIKDAVPQRWRNRLKNSHGIQVIDETKVQLNNMKRTKKLYRHFINIKYKRGTAMSK